MSAALRYMLDRLSACDESYLGYHLLGWQLRTGAGDAGLAAALGCAPGDLVGVGLCRTPRDARDHAAIEGRWGLRPGSLAEVAGN